MRFAYDILEDSREQILIIDQSELYGCASVTNAAEDVIEDLFKRGLLLPEKKVYYRDTEDRVDELCHDGRYFTGFAPGA